MNHGSLHEMSPETKKKLTFAILGLVYFAGGVEHGVSVPQGWLHWRGQGHPDYVVGMVVAVYSLTAFFAAPFMGRWVDRPGRSKAMLLLGTVLHMIGAVVEYTLHPPYKIYMTILSRSISGLGGGIDAVVLSETSKYTSLSVRTSTMAILVGARIFGVILVQGLDILVWKEVLGHLPLPDRQIASSGMCLLILWGVILALVLGFYTELCRLQPLPLDLLPGQLASPGPGLDTGVSATPKVSSHSANDFNQDTSFASSYPISVDTSLTSSLDSEYDTPLIAKSSEMIEEAEKYIQKMAGTSTRSPNTKLLGSRTFGITESSNEVLGKQSYGENLEAANGSMSTSFSIVDSYSVTGSGKRSKSRTGEGQSLCTSSQQREQHQIGGAGESLVHSLSSNPEQGRYIRRCGSLPRRLEGQGDSLLYFMFEEFLREDIIALLAVLVSSNFSLLCFQMLISPVNQELLNEKDLYSTFLFCFAILLVLLMSLGLWVRAPQRCAARWCVAGVCLLVIANIAFMVFLSLAKASTSSTEISIQNFVLLCGMVSLSMTGVLLTSIYATSLYTRLCSQQHHGLSQGVYHSFLSVSAMLAPLWVEGTLSRPLLLHGVVIALLLISLGLVCFSYKGISLAFTPVQERRKKRNSTRCSRTSSNLMYNSEQQPLLH